MLPKTAGQLPWLAVIGGLFLLLGGALRFARK
jgi:LPXTG-motif cell wall-anchored protein